MIIKLRKLVLQILAGIIGFWLADQFIKGVSAETAKSIYFSGTILGFTNFFIKPFLSLITLPLRILTFGFFSLVINIGIVWIIDILFPELNIVGLYPLLWTTITVWILSLIAYRL